MDEISRRELFDEWVALMSSRWAYRVEVFLWLVAAVGAGIPIAAFLSHVTGIEIRYVVLALYATQSAGACLGLYVYVSVNEVKERLASDRD